MKKYKKKTASGRKQSHITPLFIVRVCDTCSNDIIRENIEIAVRDILSRCSQDGVLKQ